MPEEPKIYISKWKYNPRMWHEPDEMYNETEGYWIEAGWHLHVTATLPNGKTCAGLGSVLESDLLLNTEDGRVLVFLYTLHSTIESLTEFIIEVFKCLVSALRFCEFRVKNHCL